MHPRILEKKTLESVDKDDIIDFMLQNICFLTTAPESKSHICFTHQYFQDYFAARYVLNIAEAIENAYEDCHIEEKAGLFQKFHLDENWFVDYEIYRLIGEISGDYRNIPASDENFSYHRTTLDKLLDIVRKFTEVNKNIYQDISWTVTGNIITSMGIVRNGVICGVDFSGTSLSIPLYPHFKFSLNGTHPCNFSRCKDTLYGTSFRICHATYAPDNKTILFVFQNNWLVLWDIEQEKIVCDYYLLNIFNNYQDIDYADFSPNGKYMMLLSQDIAVILETATGNILYQLIFEERIRYRRITAFSNDNHYCFIYHPGNSFFLWNLKTHQPVEIQISQNYLSDISSAIFSPDGRTLMITGNDNIIVWNIEENSIHKKICNYPVNQAFFLETDQKCLICTEQNILLWKLSDDSLSVLYTQDMILNAIFSPDGQYCIIANADGTEHLIHVLSGNLEYSINIPQKAVFSSDSKYVLIIEADDFRDSWNQTPLFPIENFTVKVTLYNLTLREPKIVITEINNFNLANIIAAFSFDSKNFFTITENASSSNIIHHSVTGEQKKIDLFLNLQRFQNCDFRGASSISEEAKEAFRRMGAIVDDDKIPELSDDDFYF